MTVRLVLTDDMRPRLAPHMRLRRDAARDTWTIQAPERTFLLDAIAHTVIARCDGHTSLAGLIEGLCESFPDAPRETIQADVTALLQDFADKGVIAA